MSVSCDIVIASLVDSDVPPVAVDPTSVASVVIGCSVGVDSSVVKVVSRLLVKGSGDEVAGLDVRSTVGSCVVTKSVVTSITVVSVVCS